MSIEAMRAELVYRTSRLVNAKRIGRPAHIARCRSRVEGLNARLAAMEAVHD